MISGTYNAHSSYINIQYALVQSVFLHGWSSHWCSFYGTCAYIWTSAHIYFYRDTGQKAHSYGPVYTLHNVQYIPTSFLYICQVFSLNGLLICNINDLSWSQMWIEFSCLYTLLEKHVICGQELRPLFFFLGAKWDMVTTITGVAHIWCSSVT